MDERSWRLAWGSLAITLVAMVLDAVSDSFSIGQGFWGFLVVLLGAAGARGWTKMNGGK